MYVYVLEMVLLHITMDTDKPSKFHSAFWVETKLKQSCSMQITVSTLPSYFFKPTSYVAFKSFLLPCVHVLSVNTDYISLHFKRTFCSISKGQSWDMKRKNIFLLNIACGLWMLCACVRERYSSTFAKMYHLVW